jgi:hypothetical protein
MNVRNARVEQAVEPFYQPENLELQLIRTHDSSLDRGVHRRCVTACCQDTEIKTVEGGKGERYGYHGQEATLSCQRWMMLWEMLESPSRTLLG